MSNTTPLNEELDTLMKTMGEKIVKGIYISVASDNDYDTQPLEDWLKQELTKLIQTLEVKARKEAVDYFYWRIDCNTLISELEGWRGCIDNAKDQTERHFSELGERGTPPNNTTTRSKE